MPGRDSRRWSVWEIVLLLLILSLAAYLRLASCFDNPGWYSDEGTHVEIARHLAEGRVRYMALTQSTLLVAKLPLFEGLLALVFRIWGVGMGQLRALTGTLGVLTVAMLHLVVRRTMRDVPLALLSALMLSIYPQAVLYSRFGFSYNLIAPLVLCIYLGVWRYAEGDACAWRGLALASLAVGVGLTAEVWMLAMLPLLLLALLWQRWQDCAWSLPLAALPPVLCALWLGLRAPQAFMFDLGYTFSRLSAASLWDQITRLSLNYTILMSQDHWGVMALTGWLLLRPVRLRVLSLAFFLLPVAFLGRSLALYNLSFYYMIPLFPLIALGAAVTLKEGIPFAARAVRDALDVACVRYLKAGLRLAPFVSWTLAATLVLLPLLTSLLWTSRQIREGFTSVIDPFLLDPAAACRAANFVNARTVPEDLVLASPGMAWLVASNVADFQMSVAYGGQATPHFPPDVPLERWAFDPSYTQARFIVVDNLWRTWAVLNVPGVEAILREMDTWEVSLEVGEMVVYCNPALGACP